MINSMINGIFSSFGIKILGITLVFVLTICLTKAMSMEEYGEYAYLISLISIFTLPAFTGWSNTVIKAINQKFLDLSSLIIKTIWFNFFVAAITLCAVVLLHPMSIKYYFYVFALSFLFSIPANVSAVIRTLGFQLIGQIPDLVLKPSLFLVAIGIVMLLSFSVDTERALQIQIIILLVLSIFLVFWVSRIKTGYSAIGKDFPLYKFSVPFILVGFGNALNANLPSVIIGNLDNISNVALYRVSQQVASIINVPLSAILIYFAPQVDLKNNSILNIKRKISVGTFLSFVPSVILSVFIIFFSLDILVFFFGEEYGAANTILDLLVLNELVLSIFLLSQLFLNMSGFQSFCFKSLMLVILVNATSCFLFIPEFGVIGACVIAIASNLLWMLLVLVKTYRVLKLVHEYDK